MSAAQILMYHRILRADSDPWHMCVSPENFDGQLQAIRRLGTPLSLQAFVRAAREDVLPARSVVLTFDDGYLDNLEQALPLLERHEVPATLYVTTGEIGGRGEFWWDRLESLLLLPDRLPEQLRLDLPEGPRRWELGQATAYTREQRLADRDTPAWSAKAGRLKFFYDVWAALWPLPAAEREAPLAQLAAWAGPIVPDPSRRTLDESEIRAISAGGLMDIGAHSIDHPPLPAHALPAQRAQIAGSQQRLQEILGRPVTSFAYPHGEHSPATVALLRECGFTSAVTVVQKIADAGSDPFLLPRFGVKDQDGASFENELRTRFERHEAASAGG